MSEITPLIVKALQEHRRNINKMREKVSNLEKNANTIDGLLARIEHMEGIVLDIKNTSIKEELKMRRFKDKIYH